MNHGMAGGYAFKDSHVAAADSAAKEMPLLDRDIEQWQTTHKWLCSVVERLTVVRNRVYGEHVVDIGTAKASMTSPDTAGRLEEAQQSVRDILSNLEGLVHFVERIA